MIKKYAVTEEDYLSLSKLPEKYPKVSIAIPTYNSERTIKRCLELITDQDYPDIEIIVIDGFSSDKTMEYVNDIKNNIVDNVNKKVSFKIFQDKGKLGAARQIGLDNAEGEIIALFDSDIYLDVDKSWLKKAVQFFCYDNNISTVWPLNHPPGDASSIAKCHSAHANIIMKDRIKHQRGVMGGGNALFRTEYLRRAGGIDRDIHWGEDFDIANKLKNKGHSVFYYDAPLVHDNKFTLAEYSKKQQFGAQTFMKDEGYKITGLSFSDILFEQYVLGVSGMLKGILNMQFYWFCYPLLMVVRSYYYIVKTL